MPTTESVIKICDGCKGVLVIPNRRGRPGLRNCPKCGGLDGGDRSPEKGMNTNIVSQQLRQLFKAYCLRREYAMNRAVVELLKRAILEDIDLGDAASALWGNNQWGEFDQKKKP